MVNSGCTKPTALSLKSLPKRCLRRICGMSRRLRTRNQAIRLQREKRRKTICHWNNDGKACKVMLSDSRRHGRLRRSTGSNSSSQRAVMLMTAPGMLPRLKGTKWTRAFSQTLRMLLCGLWVSEKVTSFVSPKSFNRGNPRNLIQLLKINYLKMRPWRVNCKMKNAVGKSRVPHLISSQGLVVL